MLLYYSKYPDQRIHVKTESGSADLAGGAMHMKLMAVPRGTHRTPDLP